MTNRNIIIGVIVVLVVIGGIWYWVSSSNGVNSTPSQTASTTTTGTASATGSTQTAPGTGTLRTLVTQGGNYTCTLTQTATSGAQTTGSIFGAGGQTRLDFKISTNGTDFTMHTIRTGATAYTWIDGQQTGTKTAITASGPIVTPASGGVIAINDDTQVTSECHPWSPVASDFVPPTGITFIAK